MALYEKALGVPAPKVTVNTSTAAPLPQPQNRVIGELFDFEVSAAELVDGDTLVFDGTEKKFVRQAAAAPAIPVIPSAFSASAPAVGDDEADGYVVGSVWFRNDSGDIDVYIAADVSAGAAVWTHVFTIAGASITII